MGSQSSRDPRAPALSSLRGTQPSPVPPGGIRATTQLRTEWLTSQTGAGVGGKHPVPLNESPLDRAQTSR